MDGELLFLSLEAGFRGLNSRYQWTYIRLVHTNENKRDVKISEILVASTASTRLFNSLVHNPLEIEVARSSKGTSLDERGERRRGEHLIGCLTRSSTRTW